MAMYGDTHRALQKRFDSRRLADLLESRARPVIDDKDRAFIEHANVADSKYVPDGKGHAPTPAWKRTDMIQTFLPQRFQGIAEREGGTISLEEYAALVDRGKG